jgi:aspartokinase-like uncharacterized kinase
MSRGARPFWDAVVKVGGSLCFSAALPAVVRHLARQARRRRLLVVPGGGPFADAVRRAWRRRGLSLAAAHRMALLAIDQYGLLLRDLDRRSVATADPAEARRAARAGRLAILLAADRAAAASELPSSWDVTSDSVAAWVARREGAARLVLVKSVSAPARRIGRREVRALARRGVVDRHLERALPGRVECWVVDGRSGRVPIPKGSAPEPPRARRSRSRADGRPPRRRRRARR